MKEASPPSPLPQVNDPPSPTPLVAAPPPPPPQPNSKIEGNPTGHFWSVKLLNLDQQLIQKIDFVIIN